MLDLTMSFTKSLKLSGTGLDELVTGVTAEEVSPCPLSTFDFEGCELSVLARVKLRTLRRFCC